MPGPRDYFSAFYIKVNGQDLPENQMMQVTDVTVEQNVHLPDACSVAFRDAGAGQGPADPLHFGLTDSNILPIGAELEVWMGRDATPKKVFNGEVIAHDLEIAHGAPPQLMVRALDRAHRLQRGRVSRSFLNVTDGDIATKIARESGLQPAVDSTSQVFPYVLQNNQTNLEFLQERANRIGYEVYVKGTTLYFAKPRQDASAALTVEMWKDVVQAHVRMTSVGQVQDVTVRCWDPKAQKAIIGRATQGAAVARGGGQQSGAALAKPFGSASMTVTRQLSTSQAEADTLAQALLDDLTAAAVGLEAELKGNPDLSPGLVVNLTSFGDRFSGQYYITHTRHHTSPRQPYATTFTVSGRRSGSLLELLAGPQQANGHGAGGTIAVGVVTNNKDPQGIGRVKVKLPWQSDDETDWARVLTPSGGSGRGIYWLPEVGDEVLVAFEQGDVHRPFVLGGLWSDQNAPPKSNSDVVDGGGKVTERILKSRSGHTITLDDTDGGGSITIADSSGQNVITIDTSSNKITLSAQGDLELKAGGNVKVSGAAISVEAQANCDIKGAMINLN